MTQKGYEILGLGVCAMDILCEVDRLPRPDTKVRVERLVKQGGGLVATALVAAARLGATTAFIGALGNDEFSRFCIHEFEKDGVSTGYITTVPGMSVITAFIMAERATGSRTIIYSIDEQPPTRPEHVRAEMFDGARVLHLDAHFAEAAIFAARLAGERGVTITVDIEYPRPGVDELLQLCDYAIVPMKFVKEYLGESSLRTGAEAMFDRAFSRGRNACAVVTDGTNGSYVVTESKQFHQPAYRVDVVDTTGCGDVFHGAFAFGLARGFSLEKTVEIAAATAALKCLKLGGRQGIPSMAEVETFLRANPETC